MHHQGYPAAFQPPVNDFRLYPIKRPNAVLSGIFLDAVTAPGTTGQSPGTLRNNFSGYVGEAFTTAAVPLTVTSLGLLVAPGDAAAHVVELVDATTGAVVASASVATAGTPAGQNAYAALPSAVTLAAGHSYYLLTQEVAGGDAWYDDNTTVTTTADLTVVGSIYSADNKAFARHMTGSYSYAPASFLYTS